MSVFGTLVERFVREAVAELSEILTQIEAKGSELALVRLSAQDVKAQVLFVLDLADLPRFGDPDGQLYQGFGLMRADRKFHINRQTFLRLFIALLGWPSGRTPGRRLPAHARNLSHGQC